MNRYRTSEIAKIIGIHPNTVRLYEELELIPKPDRMPNGYRVFTDLHIEQFRLARLAFQVEVLQNGLRKKIVQMVKVSAAGDYDKALELTEGYRMQLRQEIANTEEAIDIVKRILDGRQEENVHTMKRKEVSEYLNISMDTLRNWEMNGLLTVRRRQNGYRVYTDDDIRRLKIIRSLRCANYSLEAILTMLGQVSKYPGIDIKRALDTPKEDTEIIAVCDKLVTSLTKAESNAEKMLDKLKEMKSKF
ncbi:HTH-type transcriptional regulator CueR [Blautia producta]|uniref:HTH-type transcriptional regulator CueR n=1 Tax=Blautia producta TaxID=33035 RepID=A0A4P6M1M0_9FIRM|nr:MerR family transcriptional regulator [Blautia producta]QBE98509.1 HTH-type transcriptional regulator CueR [Blautia producta]